MVVVNDLGPMCVDGVPIEDIVGSPTQRLVLVALAVQHPRAVSDDRLTEFLWPHEAPRTRRLRDNVHRLRRALGASSSIEVVRSGDGYAFDRSVTLDSQRFEELIGLAESSLEAAPLDALELTSEALSLWRGPPFEGHDVEGFAPGLVVRLNEYRLRTVVTRARARLVTGDPATVIGDLEDLAADHPYDEDLIALLVTALHRAGRRVGALRRLRRFQENLIEQVGLDPGPRLATLEAELLSAGDGLHTGFGPIRTADDAVGNLRLPPTTFIGRAAELRALSKELATARLVTVTGVGGGGKTRLALETATAVSDEFPDGVWVCEFAPIEDATAVAAALAEVLGVRPQPGLTTTEAIVDRLARQRTLLILDNCEHVLDTAGDLGSALLVGCSELNVLATSREPLGVAGEHVWPIPPLDTKTDAVELFCARATAADATFAADKHDREIITEICRRLDGVPLSIELAAARIRAATPAEIAARLDDSFRLLRTGRDSRGRRHENLEAVIDWSYRLLDDQQRRVFERLAVFVGGFDANAAEAVCAGDGVDAPDIFDIVAELVDKSLLTAARSDGNTRYVMLETLRQYGQHQLDQHDQAARWRQQHLEHYMQVADRADQQFTSTGWEEGARIFHAEWDNLRTALGWAIDNNDLTKASRLVNNTSWFAALKLRHEHNDWATQVLALADLLGADSPVTVAGIAAWWAMNNADFDTVDRLAAAGFDAAARFTHPDTNWCWHAKTVFTSVLRKTNETVRPILDDWDRVDPRARDHFHRSLCACYRAAWLGPEQANEGVATAAALAAASPNPSLQIWAEWARGLAATRAGRTTEAIAAHRHTIKLAQQSDHRTMDATAAWSIVRTLADAGGPLEHAHDYPDCLQIMHRHRSQFDLGLWNLARHLYQHGHTEPAATIAGHTAQLCERPAFNGLYQDLTDAPNQDDIKRWQQAGAAMDSDQILDYALQTLNGIQTPASDT